MNDSKNSSKGLLVLRYPMNISAEIHAKLVEAITPIADALGVEPMVLDNGADVRIEMGSSALLERVCVALEEIAAQGRVPEVNVAEIAPQALNARPTGLNSRPATPPPAPPGPAMRREQMFYPSNYGGKPLDNGNG